MSDTRSYFRLHTTIVGMNLVDCWKIIAAFHGLFEGLPSKQYRLKGYAMPNKRFAGTPQGVDHFLQVNAASRHENSYISSPVDITNTSGLSQYTD